MKRLFKHQYRIVYKFHHNYGGEDIYGYFPQWRFLLSPFWSDFKINDYTDICHSFVSLNYAIEFLNKQANPAPKAKKATRTVKVYPYPPL